MVCDFYFFKKRRTKYVTYEQEELKSIFILLKICLSIIGIIHNININTFKFKKIKKIVLK